MSKKVFEARVDPRLFQGGMGHVVVSRHKVSGTHGTVTAGVFLLDIYCLGVKDCFLTKVPSSRWEDLLERVYPDGSEALSPECARKLIEGAISYAAGFGLAPHPDYATTSHVLSGIDSSPCTREFTYGKDGKPFYIQGPHDSPAFVDKVMRALTERAGPPGEKFDFLLALESPDMEEEE